MPVRKFRSIEEMPDPPRYEPGDPRLFLAMRSVWALSRGLCPRVYPPGVYRFRSIEDMNRQRDEWDAQFIQQLAASRATRPPDE